MKLKLSSPNKKAGYSVNVGDSQASGIRILIWSKLIDIQYLTNKANYET